MSFEPVTRFPECPECGKYVDVNAPELPTCVIDGVLYHSKCCPRCRVELEQEENLEDRLQKSIEVAKRPAA